MLTVEEQIRNIDKFLSISVSRSTPKEYGHLSQEVLAKLRDLAEACIVGLANNSCSVEFSYLAIRPAKKALRAKPECKFLLTFHDRLQGSVSHYTLTEDASERLMLRYVEYLYRLRKLMKAALGIAMLDWLDNYPVVDSSQREYQQAIARAVDHCGSLLNQTPGKERYYVWRTVPFFCCGNVYYEVTLAPARDELVNTDRFTVFSSLEIPRYYAVNVAISSKQVAVYNTFLPIRVVTSWRASARPCELRRLASILGIDSYDPKTSDMGYQALMHLLQQRMCSIRELACVDETQYQTVIAWLCARKGNDEAQLLRVLRDVVRDSRPGSNVIKYLSQCLRNGVLKRQYWEGRCDKLSGLHLKYGSIPFDNMPLCTSLSGHNPETFDVISSVGAEGREHELFAAYLKHRASAEGEIFTDRDDMPFDDVDRLVAQYNQALYYKHMSEREAKSIGSCFYINGLADDAIHVLDALGSLVGKGVVNYSYDVDRFLAGLPSSAMYNDEKKRMLRKLFSNSTVAIVYGSAGTGKSTFISLVADYMQGKRILLLAWTHAALENLERRVGTHAGEYMTVSSALRMAHPTYDLVVVDECSTIPNSDMRKLVETISCNCLLLVGDDCQIGSITFGNWFELAKKSGVRRAAFTLEQTYRTNDGILLKLWQMVREYDVLLEEYLVKHGFVEHLGPSIFTRDCDDQAILCLSYNGLYGVNNINQILQQANTGLEVEWGRRVYKIGDPIVFGNTRRFLPFIHNNTRGIIRNIEMRDDQILFDVEVQSFFNGAYNADLRWISNPTEQSTLVRINVFRGDDDLDDADRSGMNTTIVPFQIAYAISIHKAQGLEFESVKLVIPSEVDDYITRDIFYTGISRAKRSLKIFWSADTQKRIVERFSGKDERAKRMDKELGHLRQLASKDGIRL